MLICTILQCLFFFLFAIGYKQNFLFHVDLKCLIKTVLNQPEKGIHYSFSACSYDGQCCKQSYLVTPSNQKFQEFEKLTTWSSDCSHMHKQNVCQRIHLQGYTFFGRNSQKFRESKSVFIALQILWSSFKLSNTRHFWTCLRLPSIFKDGHTFLPGHVLKNSSLLYIEWIFSFISSPKVLPVFLSRMERIPLLNVYRFVSKRFNINHPNSSPNHMSFLLCWKRCKD